jgi:hypothetical protein
MDTERVSIVSYKGNKFCSYLFHNFSEKLPSDPKKHNPDPKL